MKKLVIIDGNALVHRAFHAVPPLTARNGQVVNAVYGFTTILLRVLRELKPDYMAVVFDAPGKNFRHAMYKEYKATRVKQPQDLYDQFPLVKRVVHGFGFPLFEVSGVEADDVIATIAQRVSDEKDLKKIIVTGDMDTLQLVNPSTEVHTMRKGVNDVVVYDERAVEKRFGLTPYQMVDYKALRGDPSDNIKGVLGIGEKTAMELLQQFGTLDELYHTVAHTPELIKKSILEKLRLHKNEALESKALVILKNNVALDFDLKACVVGAPHTTELVELFRALDFHSLVKRLTGESPAVEHVVSKKGKKIISPASVVRVENHNAYTNLITSVRRASQCACMAVYTGIPRIAELQWFVCAVNEDAVYAVSPALLTQEFWSEVERKQCVVYDMKSLIEVLHAHGFTFSPSIYTDLMLADYLAHPGSRNHELAGILLKQTGEAVAEDGSEQTLFGADEFVFAARVRLFFKAARGVESELKDKELMRVYETMESPLVPVLADMEESGVLLNIPRLKKLSKKITARIAEITEKIYGIAGHAFNIASPQQLKEVLFDELGIPMEGIKKGKTGLSTAASELEKMQGEHPIIDLIMEYRELAKLHNTYTDVLPTLVDGVHRIHTTFNQAVTATGRLSSSDPNLQNIPIKTVLGREIRSAFVARKGARLIKADYSQIELRIVAALSKDREMIDIFKKGGDIHRSTAAKIHNVSEQQVTQEMRSAAKAVNFGIIYGLGPHGLARGAHIGFAEARSFIDRYFEVFKGVKIYLEELKTRAHTQGYVETLFGRRRYFPEINSTIAPVRAAAERMAQNAPIQGTNADIIKLAMIELYNFLKTSYTRDMAAMVLQVHDELVFEVREDMAKEIVPSIKRLMEGVVNLSVPVVVEIKSGLNWGEME